MTMTCAGNRRINGAHSHLMELPDFLTSRADADCADGGRDPIGRFERSTERLSPAERELFFHRNFEMLYPA